MKKKLLIVLSALTLLIMMFPIIVKAEEYKFRHADNYGDYNMMLAKSPKM